MLANNVGRVCAVHPTFSPTCWPTCPPNILANMLTNMLEVPQTVPTCKCWLDVGQHFWTCSKMLVNIFRRPTCWRNMLCSAQTVPTCWPTMLAGFATSFSAIKQTSKIRRIQWFCFFLRCPKVREYSQRGNILFIPFKFTFSSGKKCRTLFTAVR